MINTRWKTFFASCLVSQSEGRGHKKFPGGSTTRPPNFLSRLPLCSWSPPCPIITSASNLGQNISNKAFVQGVRPIPLIFSFHNSNSFPFTPKTILVVEQDIFCSKQHCNGGEGGIHRWYQNYPGFSDIFCPRFIDDGEYLTPLLVGFWP